MQKIMFSDKFSLTEAVLSGRKTQTRRLVSDKLWDKWTTYDDFCNNVAVGDIPTTREHYDERKFFLDNSPFKIGEVVAVAQSYKDAGFNPDILQISTSISNFIFEVPISCDPGWRNKMFIIPALMPHQIRIKNFRVERLQDISDEDCIKEGIIEMSNGIFNHFAFTENRNIANRIKDTPREAYAALIDKISSKGTWESNPFVFAYDFELVR